jgi:hypothetical protein
MLSANQAAFRKKEKVNLKCKWKIHLCLNGLHPSIEEKKIASEDKIFACFELMIGLVLFLPLFFENYWFLFQPGFSLAQHFVP